MRQNLHLHWKEIAFGLLLVTIIIMTTTNVVNDYLDDGLGWHLLFETLIVLFSTLGIGILIREYLVRNRELEAVRQQLTLTSATLSESREKLKAAGRQYQEVIQKQFEEWQFTPSEKEVASLLLKGLSFEEISSVRDTKEKTVRQQATCIYRKSGLNGRHEFAAWFFEDFLQ